jgi:threonylcarbamoyladenosine tRNA methylthiotransferase CDKAL1
MEDVDDLEDISLPGGAVGLSRRRGAQGEEGEEEDGVAVVVPRRVRRRGRQAEADRAEDKALKAEVRQQRAEGFASLPGRGTVFLRTWGCSHNASDGEYMSGQLAAAGFRVTDSLPFAMTKKGAAAQGLADGNDGENDEEIPDVVILNSCTVKGRSQDTFLNEVRSFKKRRIPVVVAGCVPQGQPKNKEFDDLSIVGVQQVCGAFGVFLDRARPHEKN